MKMPRRTNSNIGTHVSNNAVSASQRVAVNTILQNVFDLNMNSLVVRGAMDGQNADASILSFPRRWICKLRCQ